MRWKPFDDPPELLRNSTTTRNSLRFFLVFVSLTNKHMISCKHDHVPVCDAVGHIIYVYNSKCKHIKNVDKWINLFTKKNYKSLHIKKNVIWKMMFIKYDLVKNPVFLPFFGIVYKL